MKDRPPRTEAQSVSRSFFEKLVRETDPRLPTVPRFQWNPEAKGGFTAPPLPRCKDLTERNDWKTGDTIRMAGRLTELPNGKIALTRTFLPDPAESIVEYKTAALTVDVSKEEYQKIVEKMGKLAYLAVDVTLGTSLPESPDYSSGYTASIQTIHGIEAPYVYQEEYDFFKKRESSITIPESMLVQGDVIVAHLSEHMGKLQSYIDHTTPDPRASDAMRGEIQCRLDPENPDNSILLKEHPGGIQLSDFSYPDERHLLFPEEIIQARIKRRKGAMNEPDSFDISAIELQKESPYRLKKRKEKNDTVANLLQQMETTTEPAALRKLIGEYLATRTFPQGHDSIAFAIYPHEREKVLPHLKKLSGTESLFVQECPPEPTRLKDLVRASNRYETNLLALTKTELRDFICTIGVDKQCYERMSLYRLAQEFLPRKDFETVVKTMLQPGIVEKQSDVEMYWLSRYFGELKRMNPNAMDMMEVTLCSTLTDVVPNISIISDYVTELHRLVAYRRNPLWDRKTQIISELDEAVTRELDLTDDHYDKYSLENVLNEIHPAKEPSPWKKKAVIAGAGIAAAATIFYLSKKKNAA